MNFTMGVIMKIIDNILPAVVVILLLISSFSLGKEFTNDKWEKRLVDSGLGYYGWKTKEFHLISVKEINK